VVGGAIDFIFSAMTGIGKLFLHLYHLKIHVHGNWISILIIVIDWLLFLGGFVWIIGLLVDLIIFSLSE
jgi:hypothetical protein